MSSVAERRRLGRRMAGVSHPELLARLVSDIILILDPGTGKVIDANRAAIQAFGVTNEEIRRLTILDLAAPSERARVPERLVKLRNEPMSFETEMRRADGSVFPVEVRAESAFIEGDSAIVCVVKDITECHAARARLKAAYAQLEQLFLAVPDGVAAISADRTIIRANKRFADMVGCNLGGVMGSKCYELLAHSGCEESSCPFIRFTNGESVVEREAVAVGASGDERWMLVTAAPVHDAEGALAGIVEVFKDITERKKAEEDLKTYRLLIEHAQDIILFVQPDGKILDANETAARVYGYTRQELLALAAADLQCPGSEREHRRRMRDAYDRGVLFESVHRRKDGSTFPVEISACGVRIQGREAVLCIVRNITKRKRAEEEVRYLSFHDKLTGLYNRAYFEEQLKHVHRNSLPCSIIMGDLNVLKTVNDAFGHAEGDRLLVETARIFRKSCRADDIVARIGGDEFAILLPQTSEVAALAVAERIMEECRQPGFRPLAPSISLGTATKVSQEQDIFDVVEEAERRMYRRKLIEAENFQTYSIQSLHQALQERGFESDAHRARIGRLMRLLAGEMRIADVLDHDLKLLADVHDIGKVAIPDDILKDTSSLNEGDKESLRRHPEIGYRIARTAPYLAPIAELILAHHERWDGKGYPRRLQGDAIPLGSRILAVAHAYDVMTDDAPHGQGMPPSEAMAELERGSGTRFDPAVVEAFVTLFKAGLV